MGTLKLNRNSNGTKHSAEVAEAVKRADRRVKAAVKKDFAAEALNLAAQCGYTEEQSGFRPANSVVVAGGGKENNFRPPAVLSRRRGRLQKNIQLPYR